MDQSIEEMRAELKTLRLNGSERRRKQEAQREDQERQLQVVQRKWQSAFQLMLSIIPAPTSRQLSPYMTSMRYVSPDSSSYLLHLQAKSLLQVHNICVYENQLVIAKQILEEFKDINKKIIHQLNFLNLDEGKLLLQNITEREVEVDSLELMLHEAKQLGKYIRKCLKQEDIHSSSSDFNAILPMVDEMHCEKVKVMTTEIEPTGSSEHCKKTRGVLLLVSSCTKGKEDVEDYLPNMEFSKNERGTSTSWSSTNGKTSRACHRISHTTPVA